MSREEQLERENELLRLENCVFKKVKSFSGEPGCLPRKAQAALAFELKEEGFKLKDVLKGSWIFQKQPIIIIFNN